MAYCLDIEFAAEILKSGPELGTTPRVGRGMDNPFCVIQAVMQSNKDQLALVTFCQKNTPDAIRRIYYWLKTSWFRSIGGLSGL